MKSSSPKKIRANEGRYNQSGDEKDRHAVELFAEFTDQAYYKRARPYLLLPGREWRRLRHSVSRNWMHKHLFGEEIAIGGHGLFTTRWTAVDLDQCISEGALLTDDATERYLSIQKSFDDLALPVRTSSSGNLNLWVRHEPISSALRDICIAHLLAEEGLAIRPGSIEVFPQPTSNHRWPLGANSTVLGKNALSRGFEVPYPHPKHEQIKLFTEAPPFIWPTMDQALKELHAIRTDGELPDDASGLTAPSIDFALRVKRWLKYGPGPGEHNRAMGEVILWYLIHGPPDPLPKDIEDLVFVWQRTRAVHCDEWVRMGPEVCRAHVRRRVKSVMKAFRPHARRAQAIEATKVPASDVQLGLLIFPGDVILQRAFFQFCKYVRSRLPSYSSGVVPISSHRRWRAWTRGNYTVLQDKLSDFDICVPVSQAVSGVRSTGFKIALPPATNETFASWTSAVWKVCGCDRSLLREHFSPDQVKRFFSDKDLRAI